MTPRAAEIVKLVDDCCNSIKERPARAPSAIAAAKSQLAVKTRGMNNLTIEKSAHLASRALGFLNVCELFQSEGYGPLCESSLADVKRHAEFCGMVTGERL
jgi:hypothetical protein